MLQVDAPYSDGRMFFRSDFVNMNVGSFSTNADGKWDDNWGTCTLQDCSGQPQPVGFRCQRGGRLAK